MFFLLQCAKEGLPANQQRLPGFLVEQSFDPKGKRNPRCLCTSLLMDVCNKVICFFYNQHSPLPKKRKKAALQLSFTGKMNRLFFNVKTCLYWNQDLQSLSCFCRKLQSGKTKWSSWTESTQEEEESDCSCEHCSFYSSQEMKAAFCTAPSVFTTTLQFFFSVVLQFYAVLCSSHAKARVSQPQRTFCSYCTDENWAYVNLHRKSEQS